MNFADQHMTMMNVTLGVSTLGHSFMKLNQAVDECDRQSSQTERRLFEKMLGSFMHAKGLAFTRGAKIELDGVNIYREMLGAFTNYLGKDFK